MWFVCQKAMDLGFSWFSHRFCVGLAQLPQLTGFMQSAPHLSWKNEIWASRTVITQRSNLAILGSSNLFLQFLLLRFRQSQSSLLVML